MVQAETAGAVEMVARGLGVAEAAPTLAEVVAFADGEMLRQLVTRFGGEEAVRRFAHVRSEGGRLVVSACLEPEAVALAERVASAVRARFQLEVTVHRNPNPWVAPAQRGVFFSPNATPARRFAVHFDLSPAPAA